MSVRIMIIDDEPKMGSVLKRALQREGWEVECFDHPRTALEAFQADPADIVLSDLKMPELDGIQVLEQVKKIHPGSEFVMMTAYASAQTAVESMKKGAFDYILKPFALDELKILLRRIIETRELRQENVRLKEIVDERFNAGGIVAASAQMHEILQRLRKVAKKNATVLLRGESGTGKEVLATAIHLNSLRANKPFLKINCGALPETLLESELFGHVKGSFTGADDNRVGMFEACDQGTIFLDEIGEVSPALQVKLLRVLQQGEFQRVGESVTRTADVRLLAATNRDLEELMHKGTFRQDLFYRLNVVPITIPPLRERRADVPALIDHFMLRSHKKSGEPLKKFEPDALEALLRYPWPGNIRELENAVEHALVMSESETISLDDLPLALQNQDALAARERFQFSLPSRGADDPRAAAASRELPGAAAGGPEKSTLAAMEINAIQNALLQANNNYTKAAKLLGITRRTLGYRMQKYNIPGKHFGEDADEDKAIN